MAHTPERGNHPELDTGLLYRALTAALAPRHRGTQHLNQQRNEPGEHRYTPTRAPDPSPDHYACPLARWARSLRNRTFHLPLDRSGQPRRFCSTRRRVAGTTGSTHGYGSPAQRTLLHPRRGTTPNGP
jgi:hypothetical protein